MALDDGTDESDCALRPERAPHRIYVTGGDGFLGTSVVASLAALVDAGEIDLVVSGDLGQPEHQIDGVTYEIADVTHANQLLEQFLRHKITTVVHLAALVSPDKDSTREDEFLVDVEGTRNVLNACLATGVRRIVVSSSGAAYGFHADNPEWITESSPLRGNESFAYSFHKRLVEHMLEDARVWHPTLEQVVFRIGTVLGASLNNQLLALFGGKRVLSISGSESPFVFAWDADVVACMVRAAIDGPPGIYNLAGDGALPVREVAAILGKKRLTVPAWLLKTVLWVGNRFGLTTFAPEQVKFLQFRPVLDNSRLKQSFGYTPTKTSREALIAWRTARS